MNNKKHQIFVSSTYMDLVETRNKVINSILSLEQFPAGMEMFSAANEQQWSIIQRTIDNSDYYVVIIGHRYGSIEPVSGISYTEREYDYAVNKNIPVLAFIRNRNIATLPTEREQDPELTAKLEKFIEKAKTKMCQFWDDSDDLVAKMQTALFKAFHHNPSIGWIRGDQAASPEMANELARLSRENSELRSELDRYRKNNELPELEILLNNEYKISLIYPEIVDGLIKKMQYQKIKKDEIDEKLLPFIKDEEIEEFNSKIPSIEDIDKFNKNKLEYELITNHSSLLEISIANIGIIKATEIYIDLEFPKEVRVFTEEFLEEIKEPKLEIPINPISNAHKKYMESINPFMKNINHYSNLMRPYKDLGNLFLDTKSSNFQSLSRLSNSYLLNNNGYKKLWVKGNSVSIKITDLLHTREIRLPHKLYISPLQEGEFLINCSMMCEQFKSPKNIEIPVIINKNLLDK